MVNFILSLMASLIASVVVLIIDRQRMPNLAIIMDNSANTILIYNDERGKWKSVRAKVINKRMPTLLRWLIRQTAENCRAVVSVFNEAGESLFAMRGRWVDSPQLPQLPKSEWIERLLYPDPANIIEGFEQNLDIVIMKDGDSEAFGWNNEAYLNNWKTPQYKLGVGKYKVRVDITTQNGVSFTKTADLEIGNSIETTFFK